MLSVDDLSPYEKGVVARWLLSELIGQAKVVQERSDAFDISIGVPSWQLKILAQFCESGEEGMAAKHDKQDPHVELRETLSE